MSASRMVRNGTATRFTRRVGCGRDAGVDEVWVRITDPSG
jgi:hypothetical protein